MSAAGRFDRHLQAAGIAAASTNDSLDARMQRAADRVAAAATELESLLTQAQAAPAPPAAHAANAAPPSRGERPTRPLGASLGGGGWPLDSFIVPASHAAFLPATPAGAVAAAAAASSRAARSLGAPPGPDRIAAADAQSVWA